MQILKKITALSILLLLIGSLLPPVSKDVLHAEAAGTTKISKTIFQTSTNLNMRSGASTKYKLVMTIPKGKSISATEKFGSWYRVSYSYKASGRTLTKTGWVMGTYLKPLKVSNSIIKIPTTTFKSKIALNVRSGASPKYKKLFTIPKDKTVTSTETFGGWYKISYTNVLKGKKITQTGWVVGTNLKKVTTSSKVTTFPKTEYQSTVNLNARSGASTKYKKLFTIPKGSTLTSSERADGWYKVAYTYTLNGKTATKTGWVTGKYLKESYQSFKISKTYFFTKKKTPLHASADTKKKAIYTLPANNGLYSTMKVVNNKGQTWYRISYKGKNYFIFNGYLAKSSAHTFSKTTFKANRATYLYQSFGNASTKLVRIPKGKLVDSSYKIGYWNKVSYNGQTGYIYIKYFTKYSETGQKEPELTETALYGKTYLINTNLNLRIEANENSKILTTIPKGKILIPTHKVSNGWYKVEYNEKTGYISGSYIKEVRTGDPITARSGYQFVDLRTKSPVTAAQINNYINSYVKANGTTSVLTGKGQAFIDAGNKYGVNALYLAAHAIHESAYGTSNISLGKNNLFGFGAFDAAPYIAAFKFSTVEHNIEYIAREMKATYLNPGNWKYNGAYLGFSTKTMDNKRIDSNSEGMNFYYASDPNWGRGIASHMQKILAYDKTYYSIAKPDLTVYTAPSKPVGSDIFPAGIKALGKKEIELKIDRTTSKENIDIDPIKAGNEFILLEKTNDYWVKVKVDGKVYWTNDINFVTYREYFSVKNLGRVLVPLLNVRPEPSVKKAPISTLKQNQYVTLVLDKGNNVVMDASRTWYKVKLANGELGWVSYLYVTQELK